MEYWKRALSCWILSIHLAELAGAVDFYIAPYGSDASIGSREHPFATLERARDAIRECKEQTNGIPTEGFRVVLREGRYRLQRSFELIAQDSGIAGSRVTFTAAPNEKVALVGGGEIPLSRFALVTDESILSRLPVEARGKVWSVNLRELGITEYGSISLYGGSVLPPYEPGSAAPELFVNGEVMTLARWPNDDYATIESVSEMGSVLRNWQPDMAGRNDRRGVYIPPEKREEPPRGFEFTVDTDRLGRWTAAHDAWLYGYWYWDWSDQSVKIQSIDPANRRIRTEQASGYGVRSNQRFYAFNLLEELDVPGEWYLDRSSGFLYLYPLLESLEGVAELSLNTESLIDIRSASNITFANISLGVTRGDAVHVTGGEGVAFDHCDIGNLGGKGVVVSEGQGHTIHACFIHDTGGHGVVVTGGDRKTLAPGNHAITNNEITRFSRIQKTYAPGITLAGVGNRAENNLIHDAPHAAIHFLGNDHIIARNEIHHVLLESDDAGAIYSGRRLTFWGNKIRNNYLHDILGLPSEKVRFRRGVLAHAIYLDDQLSGIEISGNVFLRCNNTVAIKGSDNLFENNVIIDCRRAAWDMSKIEAGTHVKPRRFDSEDGTPMDLDPTIVEDIRSVPYRSERWRARYPDLVKSLEETYGPARVRIGRNLLCRTPDFEISDSMRNSGFMQKNLRDDECPDATEKEKLIEWVEDLPRRFPDFMPIPFRDIGLH